MRSRTPRVRPILFSGSMVRAVLSGAKTVTRRVVSPQPVLLDGVWQVLYPWGEGGHGIYDTEVELLREFVPVVSRHCPYGAPGDRLWVRETFARVGPLRATDPSRCPVIYQADATGPAEHEDGTAVRWRPSIFMTRDASRITLEVLSVRVERLHEVDDDDVRREGVGTREEFRRLWDSINKDRAPWAENPLVRRVEFCRVGALP